MIILTVKTFFLLGHIIKDSLLNIQIFLSGNEIELSPNYIPIERFGTFANANQRILMSATTQDDSFFIKGLSFSPKAVKESINR